MATTRIYGWYEQNILTNGVLCKVIEDLDFDLVFTVQRSLIEEKLNKL